MKVVELMIYVKNQQKKDGGKFLKYSTRYNFLMEDGTRKAKYCTLRFTDKAFENSPVAKADIKRGLLVVDASKVNIPDKWVITKDENGKDVYPVCKIFGGIQSFTHVAVEHEFHFDTSDVVNEEVEEPKEINDSEEE